MPVNFHLSFISNFLTAYTGFNIELEHQERCRPVFSVRLSRLFESEKTLAFLDIMPTSRGHAVIFNTGVVRHSSSLLTQHPIPQLVIPKHHGAKLADIPDDQLSEILPVLKKLVAATGATDYNVLQNNGTIAHQQVDHVHFHMIPKPTAEEGLVVGWPSQPTDMERLKVLYEEVKAKM
ncbi:Hit family protein 1 [Ceratocystis fimbriata CBS 114723]|uniref:Hit family protein 1 n=1 Tax=Ceratocystis fimbriata CBS 114723 TaxID=1035309 RepID=A0A2C5XMH2_9PEZI|nr:Hit family protein 1 [Ceratocystis fimbriata CBS 114723]